jgi:hypothetical protein
LQRSDRGFSLEIIQSLFSIENAGIFSNHAVSSFCQKRVENLIRQIGHKC